MRGSTSRAMLFIACTVGAALATAGAAQAASFQTAGPIADWGPPPLAVVEGCQIKVDPEPPDPGSVVRMRVKNLTVDGVSVPFDVIQPYTTLVDGHFVPFSLSGVAALQVPGPHHITAEATWNIGTGTLVFSGEATCAAAPPPPPTTTTTTVAPPPTTVSPPTTAQVKASEVGLATDSNTASNGSDATEVEGNGLPVTGSGSGPLLLLGGGLIAVGALALRGSRRWRSAR